MRLLVLGGTVFLGRHVVADALARGWEVTLFHRGRHGSELFPECERLIGERDSDLAPLMGRSWDAVIDTSGYVPRVVRRSAELLSGSVGTYAFVSSVSVYADVSTPGVDESAPVAVLDDPSVEEVTGETYGALKALCETAVARELPGHTLCVRPGLIVGPYDPTDRFTYWPVRVARGGDVLAPGSPNAPVQFIDARDLACWMLDMLASGGTGTYNAVGPQTATTLGNLLSECCAVRPGARIVWVDETFLTAHGVEPWGELPLWLPSDSGSAGIESINGERAFAAGLTCRDVRQTVVDTLAWAEGLPSEREPRAGMDPVKEAAVLKAWSASAGPAGEPQR